MTIKKPYRVTQYEQLSGLGVALLPDSGRKNHPLKVAEKDYRWHWVARLVAGFSSGESAGFGLRLFTTEITDLREES